MDWNTLPDHLPAQVFTDGGHCWLAVPVKPSLCILIASILLDGYMGLGGAGLVHSQKLLCPQLDSAGSLPDPPVLYL